MKTTMGPSMIGSENGLLRGAVLLNVRGRDVGGFVEQAQRMVAERVKMPPGYYIEWSGQYENQIQRAQAAGLVIPCVDGIFALLYRTYHSAEGSRTCALAVPFALSGGIFLVKSGLNFSVGWVGFIGCSERVQRQWCGHVSRRGGCTAQGCDGHLTAPACTRPSLEGALLRLRPKVMTVATVVAGLLPLLWSTRTGAEFMRPLCCPCAGRDAQLSPPCSDCDPCDLHVAA